MLPIAKIDPTRPTLLSLFVPRRFLTLLIFPGPVPGSLSRSLHHVCRRSPDCLAVSLLPADISPRLLTIAIVMALGTGHRSLCHSAYYSPYALPLPLSPNLVFLLAPHLSRSVTYLSSSERSRIHDLVNVSGALTVTVSALSPSTKP